VNDECPECAHTDKHGWHGIEGAAHCHDCHLTWTSKRAAHCPACCAHFTSYTASDLHDGRNGCIQPAEVPGLRRAADGKSWALARDVGVSISARRSAVSPSGRRSRGREPRLRLSTLGADRVQRAPARAPGLRVGVWSNGSGSSGPRPPASSP
jgi:hypothetical protein